MAVIVFFGGWIITFRRILIKWHPSHIGQINARDQVEQAACCGLLDKMFEDSVNDVFKTGEKTIDRRRETRLIEAIAEPNKCVLKLSFNGTDAVDILLVTMEKAAYHLRWF